MLNIRTFVFLVATCIPYLAIGQCDTTLFISEYIEGSGSNNKCIEIYNPSSQDYTFDSNTDSILLFVNGSPIADDDVIPLSGMIPAQGTFVICRPGYSVTGSADLTDTKLNFNGDDAIGLVIGGVIIDLFGTIGEDPGSDWECGTNETSGGTLIRNPNILKGNPNGFMGEDPNDPLCKQWTFYEEDYSELNSHTFLPVILGGCNDFMAPMPLDPPIEVCDGESTKIDLTDQALSPDMYDEVHIEDFEDDMGFTVNRVFMPRDDDYFIRTDGSTLDARIEYSNIDGFWFGAMDNDGNSNDMPDSLKLDPINVSGLVNLRFSIELAEDDNGSSENWDADDYVRIYYQMDNGGYEPLLFISAAVDNGPPLLDTDYNGVGDGTEITDVFSEFQINIPATGNDLDILIEVSLSSNDEDIAMDNIRILSSDTPTTAFNFYNDDPECGGFLLAADVLMYDPMVTAATSPVTIYVTQTDRICETEATPIEIIVNPLPAVIAEADDSLVCIGVQIDLSETGGDADLWSWTGPDDFMSMGSNVVSVPDAAFENAGVYKVVGTINSTMCSDSSTVVVNVVGELTPPDLSVTTACTEESAIIIPPTTYVTITGDAKSLFFSEYLEGTSDNKCLEIFNGTGNEIDLSGYTVELYYNGNSEPSSSVNLEGMLSDRMTYVICNPSADDEFKNKADTLVSAVTNFNGNDVIVLLEGDRIIDVVGKIGEDPGTQWEVGGIGTMDATLIRNPDIVMGDTIGTDDFDPSAEFMDLGVDDPSDLGKHSYYGLMEVPVLFNFYKDGVQVSGPASSYAAGEGGIFKVTSIYDQCESEDSTEVEVIISPGIQELACSPVQVSVPADCDLDFSPSLFIANTVVEEMLVVEIQDGGIYIPIDQISTLMYGKELTYRLRDTCNQHSCWSTLIIEDKRPPELIIEPIELECGEDYSIEALGYPEVIECSEYTITHTDVKKGDYCSNDKVILRIFTAKDEFGNASETVQEIKLKGASLPVTPPLPDVTTDCGQTTPEEIYAFTGMAEAAYPTIDGQPIIPENFCNLSLWYEDKEVEVCDASCTFSSKISRTWYIFDGCVEDTEIQRYEQLISAKDTTPPVLEGDTLYRTYSLDPWSCFIEELPLPVLPAYDNCSDSENVELVIWGPDSIAVGDGIAYEVPVGTHVFEYRGRDCCGNITRDPRILIVTVIDQIDPYAIAKEFTVVNVTDYINLDDDDANGYIRIFPKDIDNGSWDNCEIIKYEIKRESRDRCDTDTDEYGPFVSFCCTDIDKEIDVSLKVTDSSGNTAETWGTVKVEDKLLSIECFDITIPCHIEADEMEDLIEDNSPEITTLFCSDRVRTRSRDYIIQMDYSYYNRNCNFGDIYVTWTYEDDPRLECVQKVTVEYKGDFSCENIYWPEYEYKELTCADDYTPTLNWDSGPCQLIGWNLKSDTFQFETDACAKIINEYTVIDWCIYDATFTSPEPGKYSNYIANCNKDPFAVSERGVYTFRETIKITDAIAPVIQTCVVDTFEILNSDCTTNVTLYNMAIDSTECGRLPLNWELVVISEDGEVYQYEKNGYSGQEVSFNLFDIQFSGPMETYEVRWTAWDGCGNTSHCVTEIVILDKKAPTPYCRDLGSALMNNGQLEIWAVDFNLESYDNCSGLDTLRFTFASIPPDKEYVNERHYFDENGIIEDTIIARELYENGEVQLWIPKRNSSAKVLTCSDFPSTVLEMTVWDEKWNYDFCEVNISLTDSDGTCIEVSSISGVISHEDGRNIFGVDLNLFDQTGEIITSVNSDEIGFYSFGELIVENGSKITASMPDGDYDGVTTQDVLILQDHILERNLLTSPYKIIAGDVNQDEELTAIDLLLIQRRAINLARQFTSGDWKFVVPGDYLKMETALYDAKTEMYIDDNFSLENLDFTGVRMGDLNGDVTLGLREGLKTRSDDKLVIEYSETKNGLNTELVFYSPDDEVSGLQLSLNIGHSEMVSISSESETSKIMYNSEAGMLNLGFVEERKLDKGKELFKIKLKSHSDDSQENLKLNQHQFRNEVYVGHNYVAHPLILEMRSSILSTSIKLQNRPNPFRDQTFIDFKLPSNGKVHFKFFGMDGKQLYRVEMDGIIGANRVLVQKEDLGFSSGIVYYQMTYGENIYNGKMILLE